MLLRLIEKWKYQLDNSRIIGAVLMDISKAFDCIPHDLLIAKLNTNAFDGIARVYSVYSLILSVISHSSSLRPVFLTFLLMTWFCFKKIESI